MSNTFTEALKKATDSAAPAAMNLAEATKVEAKTVTPATEADKIVAGMQNATVGLRPMPTTRKASIQAGYASVHTSSICGVDSEEVNGGRHIWSFEGLAQLDDAGKERLAKLVKAGRVTKFGQEPTDSKADSEQ